MINFTVGPVQMDKETRKLGKNQIPYFRTPEFSELMKDNEKLLCEFFDAPANSRVVFMTGSGTASMEACVMNFFTNQDKVLVVNGGSFGHRLVELCQIFEVPFEEIKLEYGKPLTKDILNNYENKGFTGFLVQLCETSTGIKYNMPLIGDFCKRNNILLFVDAISGFLADEFSMKEMNVNIAITGSQKALSLPPSLSFIVMDQKAQEKCCSHKVKSMYFDLQDYLKNGERGQTPFTPAVGSLIQMNEKLNRIKTNGGIKSENKKYAERAAYFRTKLETMGLPFRMFTSPEDSSNCVTALVHTNPQINVYKIFETLKDEYKIWICPNGGDMKEKVFRVGHIGSISKKEIDTLLKAFKSLQKRGLI